MNSRSTAISKSFGRSVNEKNEQWHHRYRTIDGYNVYGGRSALAYQHDKAPFITDRKPAAVHLQLQGHAGGDVPARRADRQSRQARLGGRAGQRLQVDDSNLPPVERSRPTNPARMPDESARFLSGEEAIAKMKVHAGMKVNLFASEEQFPELIKPVQMAWDTKGRLWVAAWRNYPSAPRPARSATAS